MHPSVALMLRNPRQRQAIERALASRGVHGDNRIVHVSDTEVARLMAMGGVGTRNPRTGLLQFYGDDVGGPGTSDVGGPGNIGGGAGARGDARARSGGDNVGGHSGGSGAEHRGQGGIIETQPLPTITQATVAPPPPVTLPPAPIPVTTAPMMSTTATMDLTGGRFGKLPGWDLKPYQIGTAPTSYPTPGLTPPPPTVTKPPPTTGGGAVVPPPPPGGGGNGGLGGLGGDPNHTTAGIGHPGLDPGVANFVDVLAQHGIHPQPHGSVALTPPRPQPGGGISPGLARTPLGQAMIANGAKVQQQPTLQPPPPEPSSLTAQQRLLMAAGGGRPQSQPIPQSQVRTGGLGGLGGVQGIVPAHPIAPPAPSKPPTKQGLLASVVNMPTKTATTKTAATTKKTTTKTGGKKDR